jgi:VWFA-related protein
MCLASGVVATAQLPTFRTDVDLVGFGVSVTDSRGNYITDLTADEFRILEDGAPQTIRLFARGDQQEPAPELHVGLLFDTSGSMGQDIQLARTAAIRFLNTLTDAKDITLVDFDTEVRVSRYGQLDFPRLVERIRSRRPQGFTAMYDALGVYLDGASDDDGRTILVLYTDGGDTRSTLPFGDVLELVRASDVTVHVVAFLSNQSSGARTEARARLTRIADATGGLTFFPTSMEDVERAYDRIVAQIRAQYTLGFSSTNARRDGSWREVEIAVTRPGLRGVRIQSRKGYFAPYAPPER